MENSLGPAANSPANCYARHSRILQLKLQSTPPRRLRRPECTLIAASRPTPPTPTSCFPRWRGRRSATRIHHIRNDDDRRPRPSGLPHITSQLSRTPRPAFPRGGYSCMRLRQAQLARRRRVCANRPHGVFLTGGLQGSPTRRTQLHQTLRSEPCTSTQAFPTLGPPYLPSCRAVLLKRERAETSARVSRLSYRSSPVAGR